jgi:hypothetical protein
VHAMQKYGRVEVQLYSFLTLALCGGEWSVLCLRCFTHSPPEIESLAHTELAWWVLEPIHNLCIIRTTLSRLF